MGAFDPLEPALILPDVKNRKTGAMESSSLSTPAADTGYTARQRGTIFINSELVDFKEFKSYKDLLNPNWKGKLAMDDPSRSGPGQATFTFFYLHLNSGSTLFAPGEARDNLAQGLRPGSKHGGPRSVSGFDWHS